MRILYLAADTNLFFDQTGGAGNHIRNTVAELRKNHEVHLAIGGDLYHKGAQKKVSNVEPKTGFIALIKRNVPTTIKRHYADYGRISKNKLILSKVENIVHSIGAENIDVIYERSCYGYDVGMQLQQKFGIPHCMETDVIMLDLIKEATSFWFNRFQFRSLEKLKYHTADTITVQSEYSVKLVKKYWGINHDRVYNKDLGIRAKEEIPIKRRKEDILEQWDIKDKFIIAYVGIFQKYQHIDVLLNSAEFLPDSVRILIIGSGEGIEEYKEYCRKRNFKNVIFTGLIQKDEISSYYNIVDMGVISDCAYHMYPVKYLEFINSNVPTVIPKYEVFKKFYAEEVDYDFMSFAPLDSKSLADTVDRVKENIERSNNILIHNQKVVDSDHTWEKCGLLVEEALQKTIEYKSEG